MKKLYIIAPLVMLGIFGVFYNNFTKEYAITEAQHEADELARIAAEEAAQKEAERLAKEEAARRTAARDAEEAAKLAEREAKWAAAGKEIADATAEYKAESDKLAAQAADLEIKLLEARNKKQASATKAFQLTKDISSAIVAKHNAEMEGQRMTEMISRKALQSSLTAMPAVPEAGR